MMRRPASCAIPFTTGILIGIGETPAERAQSLVAIRDLHERHGHIQEVIIQNFRAKPDIAMADAPEPDASTWRARSPPRGWCWAATMNVQAPPNLSPNEIELFLRAGINDWGGISPLSKDYVNPGGAVAAPRAAGANAVRRPGFRLARAARDLSRVHQTNWARSGAARRASPDARLEFDGG